MSGSPDPICLPDLTGRPFQLTVERFFPAAPERLFAAWTQGFDLWFAAPGSVLMRPEVNAPFFFETIFKAGTDLAVQRHPHYGRFLRIEAPRVVELTWITGAGGTEGAETVVAVQLQPQDGGTLLRLTHAGFATEAARDRHAAAWPMVLEHQERCLGS